MSIKHPLKKDVFYCISLVDGVCSFYNEVKGECYDYIC